MGIRGRFLFLLWIVDPFSLLLHDHLKTAIESMYERCFEVIGTEKEYNWEYRRTLGIVHTACMYRRLLPSNIALQMIIFIDPCSVHCTVPIETKRPMVPLFGALPFFPVVFISRYTYSTHHWTGRRGWWVRAHYWYYQGSGQKTSTVAFLFCSWRCLRGWWKKPSRSYFNTRISL